MTTAQEAVSNSKPPLGAELAAGIGVLSGNQTITFTLYVKMVLPLDGFVFWVNANIARPVHPIAPGLPATVDIQGSLHYSTETEQEEDSTMSINTIVFTALQKCDSFNATNPQTMYLATYRNIRFAFNSQGKFYEQADLWHYVGVAVTAVMKTQIIDDIDTLNALADKLIITNSLIYWLYMPIYIPAYPGYTCPIKKMYPSFLVPPNEQPPYASVHIEDTEALEATPLIDANGFSSQLCSETVRITTYGIANNDIITFLNFVNQYSLNESLIGIMNMPTINDVKKEQSEMQVLAQKKEIEYKISYLQMLQTSPSLGRQLIKHALVDIDVWLESGNEHAHVAPVDKTCIQGANTPLP